MPATLADPHQPAVGGEVPPSLWTASVLRTPMRPRRIASWSREPIQVPSWQAAMRVPKASSLLSQRAGCALWTFP